MAVIITTIDSNEHCFQIDLLARTHRSKGDWVWIQRTKIIFDYRLLINVVISSIVIDTSYSSSKICAHRLFKIVYTEVK